MNVRFAGCLLVALLLAASCATQGRRDYVVSRLYFGLSSPTGRISDADVEKFVDDVITPRFPDGLTYYNTRGQWRGKDAQLVKEPGAVVEIVHRPDPVSTANIEAIIVAYKERFAQEAVMLVEDWPNISFR
ncbi:MAG: DUF3574 domain-containing protein [Planctomycetota bacterium]